MGLREINDYVAAYRTAATQMATYAIGGDWYRTGIPADQAAAWASAGFLPEEALPLIAQGMTPELAAAGDDALVGQVGVIEAARLKLSTEGGEVVVSPWIEEPPTHIGLTAHRTWDASFSGSPPLLDQMTASGMAHTVHQLPQIVGMGGNAYLCCYTSPKTSQPVTVLVVPQRADVDQFAEDYFYFEGMDEATALADDFEVRWAQLYDQARLLS